MNKNKKRTLLIFLIQIASFILFFILWEILVRFNILTSLLVASPSQIIKSLNIVLNAELINALLYTLYVMLISMIISIVTGIGLGILIGGIKYLKEGILPYFILIYATPKVIFLPIFWFLFGLGLNYQVSFAVFHGILPIAINLAIQINMIDKRLITIARSFGASSYNIYTKVILPSLMPILLGSIRLCFYGVVVGIVISQLYIGNTGVGYLAGYYTATYNITNLYGLILIFGILVMIIYWGLIRVEVNYLKKRGLLKS